LLFSCFYHRSSSFLISKAPFATRKFKLIGKNPPLEQDFPSNQALTKNYQWKITDEAMFLMVFCLFKQGYTGDVYVK